MAHWNPAEVCYDPGSKTMTVDADMAQERAPVEEQEEEEQEEDGEEADGEAPCADVEEDSRSRAQRRAVCVGCGRPKSVCLCAAFPAAPLQLPADLRSVLLLRHPKERRQKHQSAWIRERCVAGVRQHVTRKLPTCPPAGLEFLYDQPQSCLLVFPAAGAK